MKDKRHYSFLLPAFLTVVLVFEMLSQTQVVLKALPERLQLIEEVEAKTPDPKPIEKAAADETMQDDLPQAAGNFMDGVYTGSSDGYGGRITVQVTVTGGQITDVTVLAAPGETEPYYTLAKSVIDSVKRQQSWDVDTVSGATYSSRGILGAIRNALTGEEVSNEAPPKAVPEGSKKQDSFTEPKAYIDGTYEGSAVGFGGKIKVSVVIRDGKIADIKIISASGETGSYLSRAKNVIARILKKGSPNVDTVSGATYSSAGIINAVKRALKKAAAKDIPAETEQELPEPETAETQQETVRQDDFEDASDYENGIWYGTADGFGGRIQVAVTIVRGKIGAVRIVNADDETPEYLSRAKKVIPVIVKQNSPNVDAVSGATYSSTGIINAVKRALKKASKKQKEKPEKETKTPETETASETDALPEKELKDGVYTGTGTGYEEGIITVQMTVSGGRITELSVISADYDTPSFLKRAQTLFPVILKKQNADVDVVSGATFSSNGILDAVKNAVIQAEAAAESEAVSVAESETETETESMMETETETETETESEEGPAAGLEDGVYTGTALCTDNEEFCYDIRLSLTVSEGRITDVGAERINDVSEWAEPEDNDYYLDRALNGWGKRTGLKKQLLEKQSAEIDVVSGATYSSETIKKIAGELLAGNTVKSAKATSRSKSSAVKKKHSAEKTDETGAEKESGSESESARETEAENVRETEPETVRETEVETVRETEAETVRETAAETVRETEPETEAETEKLPPETETVVIETNSTGKEADDQ